MSRLRDIPEVTSKRKADFEKSLDKSGECWLWTGGRLGKYGGLKIKGSMYLAHRVSYMIHEGQPGQACVCHTCDTPLCCNPSHLFLGTYSDNMNDMYSKGRQGNRRVNGERNGNAKLTEEQVIAVFKDDRKQRVIADQYGIAQSVVSNIKRGARWKSVTSSIV